MIKHGMLIVVSLAAMPVASACGRTSDGPASEGRPAKAGDYVPAVLYGANCAGCHGANGNGGAARGLRDPVFLDIADETTMRRITAAGVPGTAMPPFAKESGGSLTDEQIDTI